MLQTLFFVLSRSKIKENATLPSSLDMVSTLSAPPRLRHPFSFCVRFRTGRSAGVVPLLCLRTSGAAAPVVGAPAAPAPADLLPPAIPSCELCAPPNHRFRRFATHGTRLHPRCRTVGTRGDGNCSRPRPRRRRPSERSGCHRTPDAAPWNAHHRGYPS